LLIGFKKRFGVHQQGIGTLAGPGGMLVVEDL
jgi:hypothetical protein